MILIVGLGNPGPENEKTRHNAGFITVDNLRETTGELSDWRYEKKFLAEISEGKVGNPEGKPPASYGASEKIILAKPQTFMNNSGKTVGLLAKYFKVKPQNVWVVHDDADLPLGTIKIVKNRGSGGHKGVESVMRALKTRDFVRFRIGTRLTKSPRIPHRPKKFMADFVLGKITPSQEPLFKKTIKKCVEAIITGLKDGIEKAMSIYNR